MRNTGCRLTRYLIAAAVLMTMLVSMAMPVAAVDVAPPDCYWYNIYDEAVTIPDAYTLSETIDVQEQLSGVSLEGITDSFMAVDGKFYLLDASGIIIVLDAELKVSYVLDAFVYDNEYVTLNKPEGLFVDENGDIFVADTLNKRIVYMNDQGYVLNILNEPDNLTGFDNNFPYHPSKVVVDSAGRVFVVVRNVNMGIVVLDKSGAFITYRGAPSVTLSVFDAFWRKFSTQEQLDRMTTYVPTEYNNLTISDEDFIYGTISALEEEDALKAANDTSGKIAPIKKLNLAGSDILRREGMYSPVGDLIKDAQDRSMMIDIALSECGIYTALDSQKGRLFTYSDDGELLFAFGSKGDKKGQFNAPVAIAYKGDDILVVDGYTNRVYRFETTEYGSLVLSAIKGYYNGDYETAYASWGKVLDYNSNLSLAYVGVGKSYLQEQKYEEAMECFKIGHDTANYSKAYRKVRDNFIRTYFSYIVMGIIGIAVIAVLFSTYKRIERYSNNED